MRFGSWGVVCAKLVVTVLIWGLGSEWVVVGLPEALLSDFLNRGILMYVYSVSVFKNLFYLLVTRCWKEGELFCC